ncbi:MAG: DUF1254 domain-containing protein [Pirellulales bacterium]
MRAYVRSRRIRRRRRTIPRSSEATPRSRRGAAQDDADLQRAITAYRFWYPTVSCEGMIEGGRAVGVKDNAGFMIMACGPKQVAFTPNADTPYGACAINLTDGPWVIEIPPGPFIGLVDDHHQGWVLDMGLPGPAGPKGGKHLILPPGYEGDVPTGYYAGKCMSNIAFVAIRSMPQNGDLKAALEALRKVKIYPLVSAANPKLLEFIDVSDRAIDSTCLKWEDNLLYWEKLNGVIQQEPIVEKFFPMYGQLAALGIEKGKPFQPDVADERNSGKGGQDRSCADVGRGVRQRAARPHGVARSQVGMGLFGPGQRAIRNPGRHRSRSARSLVRPSDRHVAGDVSSRRGRGFALLAGPTRRRRRVPGRRQNL